MIQNADFVSSSTLSNKTKIRDDIELKIFDGKTKDSETTGYSKDYLEHTFDEHKHFSGSIRKIEHTTESWMDKRHKVIELIGPIVKKIQIDMKDFDIKSNYKIAHTCLEMDWSKLPKEDCFNLITNMSDSSRMINLTKIIKSNEYSVKKREKSIFKRIIEKFKGPKKKDIEKFVLDYDFRLCSRQVFFYNYIVAICQKLDGYRILSFNYLTLVKTENDITNHMSGNVSRLELSHNRNYIMVTASSENLKKVNLWVFYGDFWTHHEPNFE